MKNRTAIFATLCMLGAPIFESTPKRVKGKDEQDIKSQEELLKKAQEKRARKNERNKHIKL